MTKHVLLTFPSGDSKRFEQGVTVSAVARSIAPSLARKAISATVNGQHWDLQWPIEQDSTINIHTHADTEQSLELIRHDLAHIMARAVQELWDDVNVTIGPVIENGWYYDFDCAKAFTSDDLVMIENKMRTIIRASDPIRTEIWSRKDAVLHYENQKEPYKIELIDAIPQDQPIRMYWHGNWQDLCRGPHLQNTGQIPEDAFRLTAVAGAYWRGDVERPMLQRIYGVAFQNKKQLDQHFHMLEEAAKRDHRKLGRDMGLFHFQEDAPGQVFWHAEGWSVYTELQNYMRRRQRAHGYIEVNTPQVVARKLWEESGHWDKYQENMFIVEIAEEHTKQKAINALKPMNCPCHVQIFNQGVKSYRDLPLKMAEFGICNRYEPSGALHGLMRVRGFTQDDAHIFCAENQIERETQLFIEFLSQVYADLGFDDFTIKFSDRPKIRSGSDDVWDRAESSLKNAMQSINKSYTLNRGEGAFYGPKLEFVLTDAIGRDWQCGTYQVDFVLPQRLDAHYIGADGNKHRPVMLHRAVLGSFERFIGILIEQNAGHLPFWLAPRQVVVASVVSDANGYVQEVTDRLMHNGIRASADIRNEKIGYKVREHSVKKVSVILVAGVQEVANNTITIRRLGKKDTQTTDLDKVLDDLMREARPPDT